VLFKERFSCVVLNIFWPRTHSIARKHLRRVKLFQQTNVMFCKLVLTQKSTLSAIDFTIRTCFLKQMAQTNYQHNLKMCATERNAQSWEK